MVRTKGFTLIEIIVVMVIIGILAALAIPNYNNMIQQGQATAARGNLITIYNAQKNYYLNPTTGGNFYNSATGNDLTNINAALGLSITDINFQYTCATAAGPSYTCTATNVSDANLILTVTSGTPNAPNMIVLPGGVTCGNPTGANPGCNPSCATNIAGYCPN
jgi:prepilin-type N-terminal cleavage/methylation domain-containing protein